MIGRTLGRYQVSAKLGEGGNASVWLAHDPLLQRCVALKVPTAHLVREGEARRRFLREARAASSLDHPGIATVYDFGEDQGDLFIAFQFIEGVTVAQRAGDEALPLAEALRIATAAAEALAYAHARGVVHRDITANNLMLGHDGRVVIVDFGLAFSPGATRVTRSGELVGTLPYMAPEVCRGKQADARVDLYGLGVVIYRLVTGRLPFDGANEAEIIQRILNEAPRPPSDARPEVPSLLDRVVLRLLEKDPVHRYSGAEGLLEDLRRQQDLDRARPRGYWGRLAGGLERLAAQVRRSGRARLLWATTIIFVVLMAAVGRLVVNSLLSYAPHRRFRSVAVLPFQNWGRNQEGGSDLANGLGEELSKELFQLARRSKPTPFGVTPWFTSGRVTNLARPLRLIAQELRVDGLVVGTFQVEQDGLHATVSLIDGASGDLRWLREFLVPNGPAIGMQRDLAAAATRELKGPLTGVEPMVTPPRATAGLSETSR